MVRFEVAVRVGGERPNGPLIPVKGPMCPDAKYDPLKSYPPQCRKQCTQPKDWNDEQKEIYDKACQAKQATVVKEMVEFDSTTQ